jgi:hypothetical protein
MKKKDAGRILRNLSDTSQNVIIFLSFFSPLPLLLPLSPLSFLSHQGNIDDLIHTVRPNGDLLTMDEFLRLLVFFNAGKDSLTHLSPSPDAPSWEGEEEREKEVVAASLKVEVEEKEKKRRKKKRERKDGKRKAEEVKEKAAVEEDIVVHVSVVSLSLSLFLSLSVCVCVRFSVSLSICLFVCLISFFLKYFAPFTLHIFVSLIPFEIQPESLEHKLDILEKSFVELSYGWDGKEEEKMEEEEDIEEDWDNGSDVGMSQLR